MKMMLLLLLLPRKARKRPFHDREDQFYPQEYQVILVGDPPILLLLLLLVPTTAYRQRTPKQTIIRHPEQLVKWDEECIDRIYHSPRHRLDHTINSKKRRPHYHLVLHHHQHPHGSLSVEH